MALFVLLLLRVVFQVVVCSSVRALHVAAYLLTETVHMIDCVDLFGQSLIAGIHMRTCECLHVVSSTLLLTGQTRRVTLCQQTTKSKTNKSCNRAANTHAHEDEN